MNTAWLIAVDGSTPSLNAVDYAIVEAGSRAAKPLILLINVQAALSGDITRFVDAGTVEEFHREAGEAALVVAKEKLAAAGLPHSAHVLVGEVAPTIVEFAKDKGCSLIIMGAHGFGSVIGLVMGSITTKVIHLTDLPVLLIK